MTDNLTRVIMRVIAEIPVHFNPKINPHPSSSVSNPDLLGAVKSYRSQRGESESSTEEEGKPVEKPSCKVPCIPRAEAKAPRDHITREHSPSRTESPDQVYHRLIL